MDIGYFDVILTYYENNKVQYKNRIFKAKGVTVANYPPELPLEENDFWALDN